jgi:hypothetical protein
MVVSELERKLDGPTLPISWFRDEGLIQLVMRTDLVTERQRVIGEITAQPKKRSCPSPDRRRFYRARPALGFFDTERHLSRLRNCGLARIVKANFGLHRHVDVAHNRHICLLLLADVSDPCIDGNPDWIMLRRIAELRSLDGR